MTGPPIGDPHGWPPAMCARCSTPAVVELVARLRLPDARVGIWAMWVCDEHRQVGVDELLLVVNAHRKVGR